MNNPAVPAHPVQLLPSPMVIDADGLPVTNSHLIEIVFAADATDTPSGRFNTIVGPGTAKIMVGDATHRDIGLC